MRLKAINYNTKLAICLIVIVFFPALTMASGLNSSAFGAKSMPQIVVLVQQGNLELAKTSLKKMLALDSGDAEAHYWLAKVYSRLNDDTGALKHLAQSHALASDKQQISIEYAALLNKLKQYSAAISVYQKILKKIEFRSEKIKVTRLLKLVQGRMYAENREFDLALSHYQALNLMYPSDVLVLESLGYIYAQLEFWDEAETFYHKAIDLAPDNQNVQMLMAKMYRKQGDGLSKREHLLRVLEIDSENANGKLAAKTLLSDGRKLLRRGEADLALTEFNTILEVLPHHLEAKLATASVFEQSKSFQQAKKIYLSLQKNYPNKIKLKSRLARLYLVFDKIDDAIVQYQFILASAPQTHWAADASIKLGMLYTHKAEHLSKNLRVGTNRQQAIDVIKLWVKNSQFESAQWLLDKVIRVYPKDAEAKYLQGVIYEQNGQLELALSAQTQSIWLNPKHIDARMAYARLLTSFGDLNEAEAAYRDILSSNIGLVNRTEIEKLIGFAIGEKLVRSKKLPLAISHYRKMQKTYLQDVTILQRIADVYVTLGDVSEANAVLNEIMRINLLDQKQKKYFEAGKKLAENERYKDAYTQLKRALKFGSGDAELFYWLGLVASHRYELADSSEYYKRSLKLGPDSVLVRESYARLLIKAGNKALAKEQYEKAYVMANDTEKRKEPKRLSKLLDGQLLLDEDRLEEALSLYQTMNIMFSNDVEVLEQLANVMVKLGLLAEAREAHLSILRIAPANTVSYIRLADIAEQRDENEERLELLSTVIQLDSQHVGEVAVKMLLKEARELIAEGDYFMAKTALAAILSVKPKERNANQLLAESLVLTEQYDEAEAIYLRLLALSPSDLKARERLAELYVNSNKMSNALSEYRKIYDIAPSTEVGQSANAKLNFLYGLEAERLSKKLDTESDIDNALGVAIRWVKDERLDAALWLLSSIVENNTLNPEVYYWLGVTHEKRGEFELALNHIDNGLEFDGDHVGLIFVAANLNARLGRFAVAETQYLKLIPLLHNDEAQRKEVSRKYTLLIGSSLVKAGKLTEALKHFRNVQRTSSQDIEVLAKIGDVLNKMGRPGEAKAVYRAALKIDPNSALINIALSNLYKQLGDYKAYLKQLRYVFLYDQSGGFGKNTVRDFKLDKGMKQLQKKRWSAAVVAFNRVLETNPNNIYAQVGISSAYLQSGQLEKAKLSFNQISKLKNDNINMRLKYLYVKTGYAFSQ